MRTRTGLLTLNALTVALTAACTLLVRIPVPATQGYINLGDAMIFVSALLLGPRTGAIAGGMGSSLADLLGGYAHWAPFTLVIKGLEGWIVGRLVRREVRGGMGILLAGVCALTGGLWMVLGYFFTETVLYGWQPALVALPGNFIQAGASLLAALPVASALTRTGILHPSNRDYPPEP